MAHSQPRFIEEISLIILTKSNQLGPQLNTAISIKQDLSLKVFVNSVQLSKIGDKRVPFKADRISVIHQLCEDALRLILSDSAQKDASHIDFYEAAGRFFTLLHNN